MVLAAISSVVREIRCKWLIQITVKKLGSFPQRTYRTGHIHVRRRRLEFNKNPSKGLIFSSKFFSVSIRATEKKKNKNIPNISILLLRLGWSMWSNGEAPIRNFCLANDQPFAVRLSCSLHVSSNSRRPVSCRSVGRLVATASTTLDIRAY